MAGGKNFLEKCLVMSWYNRGQDVDADLERKESEVKQNIEEVQTRSKKLEMRYFIVLFEFKRLSITREFNQIFMY